MWAAETETYIAEQQRAAYQGALKNADVEGTEEVAETAFAGVLTDCIAAAAREPVAAAAAAAAGNIDETDVMGSSS